MNIFKTIKERINNNLTVENNENGFSMVEGIMGVAIVSTMTVVGVSSVNGDGEMGLFDQAKQVQTASLLQDTMTNIVFYDIDGDPETDTKYTVDQFNKVNSEKGFTVDYRQNDECLAVQVMADNGLSSVQTDGKNCDTFVAELNDQADEVKNSDDKTETNVVLAYLNNYISENADKDTEVEVVYNIIPRETLEDIADGESD